MFYCSEYYFMCTVIHVNRTPTEMFCILFYNLTQLYSVVSRIVKHVVMNLQGSFAYYFNLIFQLYLYCVVCIVIHVISEPTEMFLRL